jgi:hypothetical protein
MSFWIIENEEQLNKLSYNKSCYINVIPLNHNYHPILSSISLIYYRAEGDSKGFMFPINHNDGIDIDLNLIKEFLLKHKQIYCLDKKELLYFLGEEFKNNKVIDINLLHLEQTIFKLEIPDYKQTVANYIEGSFKSHIKLNSFIPITKHYEEQESIYYYIQDYIGNQLINTFYNNEYVWVMYCIEKQGISLNNDVFNQHFQLKYPKFSIKDNKIYSKYNLYNFTTRPSNSFNGVNFAALNKNDNTREFIIPKEDYLFEYDFRAYHLYLSAKLINFELPKGDIHTELGKFYFNKTELTEEEYKKSKQLSFKMMNGGVFPQYKHVPFWSKLEEYIKNLWEEIQKTGFVELIGGRKLLLKEIQNSTPQKVYNYIIQSAETYYNVKTLSSLLKYLDNKKSKCILYSYDAMLIDYSSEDDKQILKEIKNIIEEFGFQSSVSYGKNYNNLIKLK